MTESHQKALHAALGECEVTPLPDGMCLVAKTAPVDASAAVVAADVIAALPDGYGFVARSSAERDGVLIVECVVRVPATDDVADAVAFAREAPAGQRSTLPVPADVEPAA